MKKIILLNILVFFCCIAIISAQTKKVSSDTSKHSFKKRYVALEILGSPLNITYGKSFYHNDRFNLIKLFSVSPLAILASKGFPSCGFGVRTEYSFKHNKHLYLSNETKLDLLDIYYPSISFYPDSYFATRYISKTRTVGISGVGFILSSNLGLNCKVKRLDVNLLNFKLGRTLLNGAFAEEEEADYFILIVGTGINYKF